VAEGSWAQFYASQPKKKKYEDDEEETPPLEVVKIKTGNVEVVTGIVQPAIKPTPWKKPERENPFGTILPSLTTKLKAAFRLRKRSSHAADDEWLMMQ
jgi:hypothetical protein